MSEKIKETVAEEKGELESLPVKGENKELNESFGSFKDVAGKTADLVNDAAKDAVNFAGVQLKNAKSIFDKVSKDFEENITQQKIEKYKPVFPENLVAGDMKYPAMIRVIDYDDKNKKMKEFGNAVGFQETVNKVEVLEIYKEETDKLGVLFYPNNTQAVYYVHPLQNDFYISMDKYFVYLKEARVAELKRIAQDLGAKEFNVEIVEEITDQSSKDTKGDAKIGFLKNKLGAGAEKKTSNRGYRHISIEAKSKFAGKDPVRPVLRFWADNEMIKTLVDQRLSPDNRLTEELYFLDFNLATGINEMEAAKIDGALKAMKFGASAKIAENVKKESRQFFKYEIKF